MVIGSELTMYALLLAQPLIGWAMVSASGQSPVVFGGCRLPRIAPFNSDLYFILRQTHSLFAYASWWLSPRTSARYWCTRSRCATACCPGWCTDRRPAHPNRSIPGAEAVAQRIPFVMRRPGGQQPASMAIAMVILICAPVAGCSAPPDPTSVSAAPTTGSRQITPLLDSTLSTPRWFTGTDGQAHLAYELLLTNAVPAPVVLNTVEVDDADTGATLIRLTGEPLRAATSAPTSADTPTLQVPPSSVVVVWLDIPLAGNPVPAKITHRIAIDPLAGVPMPAAGLSFTGAPVEVDRRPPVTLSPPLTGSQWTALGSCCDGPHRRALYPVGGKWYLGQRFAIDFNQLDAENRPGIGDPLLPASFPTFGQPVYAVAEAPSSRRWTVIPT